MLDFYDLTSLSSAIDADLKKKTGNWELVGVKNGSCIIVSFLPSF
jgi:hypothetical protein